MKKLSVLFVIFLCFACKTEKFTPESFTGRQLTFGSGGGFTGQTKEYILLENGQLFLFNSMNKETKELKLLKKNVVKGIFKQVDDMKLEAIDYSKPDNMTNFINLKTGKSEHRIEWGSTDAKAPENIKKLYKTLIESTK